MPVFTYRGDFSDGVSVSTNKTIGLFGLDNVGVCTDGTCHKSAVLVALLHDLVQVSGFLAAQVVELSKTSGEVFQSFNGAATTESFVGAAEPRRENLTVGNKANEN